MSYIDFVLKCADYVWYIYKINCRVPHAETTLGNCGRYMLPVYGLVALTMLKPVHRVFRSYDVFPPKNARG